MVNLPPGVVGGVVIVIDPHTAVSKLDRIGFAEQDHTSPFEFLDRVRICGGNIFFEKT